MSTEPGAGHFAELPDEWKWKFLTYEIKTQNPAPRHTLIQLMNHANVRIYTDCAIRNVTETSMGLLLDGAKGTHELDFLILGTGFTNAPHRRAELKTLASKILLWRDVYSNVEFDELATSPYLGRGFSFQEKSPGACPGIARIRCLAHAASLTRGKLTAGIPNLTEAVTKTAESIAAQLFVEDKEHHFAALQRYDVREISEEEELRLLTSR